MNEFNEHLGLLAIAAGLLSGIVWFLTNLTKEALELTGKKVKLVAFGIAVLLGVLVEIATNHTADSGLKMLYGFLLGCLSAAAALGIHGVFRESPDDTEQSQGEGEKNNVDVN